MRLTAALRDWTPLWHSLCEDAFRAISPAVSVKAHLALTDQPLDLYVESEMWEGGLEPSQIPTKPKYVVYLWEQAYPEYRARIR